MTIRFAEGVKGHGANGANKTFVTEVSRHHGTLVVARRWYA